MMTLTKKERKQLIFGMFAAGRTYEEIGREFGITRQRVQQIVKPPVQVWNALVKRSGGKCERCRIILRAGDAHMHHVTRDIVGDYRDLKRVRLLCRSCHRIEDIRLEPQKYRHIKNYGRGHHEPRPQQQTER